VRIYIKKVGVICTLTWPRICAWQQRPEWQASRLLTL